MLMTERFGLRCVELRYLLWAEEIPGLVRDLDALPLHQDHWRITTVYLDRRDGLFARGALACPDAHVELRLREYFTPDGDSISPRVWIECKEQNGPAGRLNRFPLHRRLVPAFLKGRLDESEILDCQERFLEPDRVRRAVRAVRAVAGPGPLECAGAVSYRRRAVEGGSPLARLTLDQDITYHLGPASLDESRFSMEPGRMGPCILAESAAVVEVKFRGAAPPAWCGRTLPSAGPVHYSKFLILSALAQSDRMLQRAESRFESARILRTFPSSAG